MSVPRSGVLDVLTQIRKSIKKNSGPLQKVDGAVRRKKAPLKLQNERKETINAITSSRSIDAEETGSSSKRSYWKKKQTGGRCLRRVPEGLYGFNSETQRGGFSNKETSIPGPV